MSLTLDELGSLLPAKAMQNQVAKLVSSIEARTVTQPLVGPEGNYGPIRKVDAERVNFFDADTKSDDNYPVFFKKPNNVLNWSGR